MTWHTYKLDEIAQELVLDALERSQDSPKSQDSLNQSYKMRTTVAFGLERFWGEHVRLLAKGKSDKKSDKESENYKKGLYWHDTWKVFRKTMGEAQIHLPKPLKKGGKPEELKQIAGQFWGSVPIKVGETEVILTLEDRRVAQAVLTQLCDCLVWWTQRYKS